MELGKILGAVKIPTIALIVLWIVQYCIDFVIGAQSANIISATSALGAGIAAVAVTAIFFLLNMAIFFWAGFKTAKEVPGSAVEGAVGAAIAAAIFGIATGILTGVFAVIISIAMSPAMGASAAAVAVLTVALIIASIVFNVVVAAVLGAIGGFVGKAK